jgi:hypothetical protein
MGKKQATREQSIRLTTEEVAELDKLLRKERKKLMKKTRGRDSTPREVAKEFAITSIWCKLDPEESESEPVSHEVLVTAEAGSVPSPPPEPVLHEVCVTAETKVRCRLHVEVSGEITQEEAWKALQKISNNVKPSEFRPCRPMGDTFWSAMDVSSGILSPEEVEEEIEEGRQPDFLLSVEPSVGTGEPMHVLRRLVPEACDEALADQDERWYRDADGHEVLLEVRDKDLIHSLIKSEVGDYLGRKRGEEVVHHQELLKKIGPRGSRILSQLKRLPDDNQRVREDTGGGG